MEHSLFRKSDVPVVVSKSTYRLTGIGEGEGGDTISPAGEGEGGDSESRDDSSHSRPTN